MYLSRVELDTKRRSTMAALIAPQKFHGAIESSFPGERRRRLWRLDRLGGKLYLLLLSEQKPDLTKVAAQFGSGRMPETKEYNSFLQRIQPGSIWQFRLTANPTKSRIDPVSHGDKCSLKRGKVQACSTVDFQEMWLRQRAEKHGFILPEDGVTITASRWLHFVKGNSTDRTVSLLSVTYEGVLQVTDVKLFRCLLTEGIGRGKAYGLGLMTIMHYGGTHG